MVSTEGGAFGRPGRWQALIDLKSVERKIFWLIFAFLGLIADFVLPIWWALGATIPIFFVSWWVAYRSDWF